MQGWIRLYRNLLDKPIWLNSTAEQKTILITLLLMANHKEKEWEWKGKRFKAKPGQFVTSLNKIILRCGKGVTVQKLRTAITRFEKYEFLTNESSNQNRPITIVNWEKYQSPDGKANKQINKQITNNQQTGNKQLTTNNNVNNNNNLEEEDIYNKIEQIYKKLERILKHKNVKESIISQTINELKKRKVYSFKISDVESQIEKMEKYKATGGRIRNFPSYFAQGLEDIISQDKISEKYKSERKVELDRKKRRDTSIYINWLGE